jgi:hypothetical protein
MAPVAGCGDAVAWAERVADLDVGSRGCGEEVCGHSRKRCGLRRNLRTMFWVSTHRGWAMAPEVDDENQGWKKVQQQCEVLIHDHHP